MATVTVPMPTGPAYSARARGRRRSANAASCQLRRCYAAAIERHLRRRAELYESGPEQTTMADIVLINPRFEVSYWGLEHALAAARQEVQSADRLPAAARRADARRASRHDRRRERRADRLRPAGAGRHRGADRHERPARPDAGDPPRTQSAWRLHRRRRSVGHRAGGLLRRPGRRDLRRRSGRDLAAVPRRVGAGPASAPLRASRADRHDARCRCRGTTC